MSEKQDKNLPARTEKKALDKGQGKKLSPAEAKTRSKNIIITAVLGAAALVLFIAAFAFIGSSARSSYDEIYSRKRDEVSDSIKNSISAYGEAQNRVSSNVKISIDSAVMAAKLEVLCVRDVEYVITEGEGFDRWLEVPGTGMFTVDLSIAEIIADSERGYVKVTAPAPELSAVNVDIDGVNVLMLGDDGILSDIKNLFDIGNGSIEEGVKAEQADLAKGQRLLEDSISKNKEYNKQAEDTAREMITAIIKNMNIGRDIEVDVAFERM